MGRILKGQNQSVLRSVGSNFFRVFSFTIEEGRIEETEKGDIEEKVGETGDGRRRFGGGGGRGWILSFFVIKNDGWEVNWRKDDFGRCARGYVAWRSEVVFFFVLEDDRGEIDFGKSGSLWGQVRTFAYFNLLQWRIISIFLPFLRKSALWDIMVVGSKWISVDSATILRRCTLALAEENLGGFKVSSD